MHIISLVLAKIKLKDYIINFEVLFCFGLGR